MPRPAEPERPPSPAVTGGAGADPLAALLAGRFRDPEDGRPLTVPPLRVVLADSLAGSEAALVEELGLGPRLAVVLDPDTERALGGRVVAALARPRPPEVLRLPERPRADLATGERILREARGCSGLVAVGAGTVNDLCKFVAARLGRPYAVFATAPSMNGYVSGNAALTVDGHKRSLSAVPPAGAFFDLEVLAAAPVRLIRAGLGDSLCRSTAQRDWLLSHMLLGTPYREAPFALLAADEPELLAGAAALVTGDREAVRRLVRTLVLSGLGMTLCGGSQPASQGEHLLGHYAEMMAPARAPAPLHGEQIAVTTLTMARLQERMLAAGPPELRPTTIRRADLEAHFGVELGRSCWEAFAPKFLDGRRAAELTERLREIWPHLTARLSAVAVPPARLEAVLRAAGAPRRPADLGWSDDFHRNALRYARTLRDRFTFLDLAAESGVAESLAAA